MKKDTARASAAVSGIFGFTLFLSAAIMFALQPMTGKMLLPLVGGTPAGWIVALAFFQAMLLAGYLLAHLFSRLSPRGHGAAFVAMLLAGTLFLPLGFPAQDETPRALGVFTLLAANVALPFIALSMATSTLQRLFTATSHDGAQDPYFLFAASNLGSFTGLLLYPFLAEPLLTLGAQGEVLRFCYYALIALGFLCLFVARGKEAITAVKKDAPLPATATRLQWLFLALVPSSLLLGITTYVTTDLFSGPMLWIVPLALYLLTFVIAFGKTRFADARIYALMHPYAVCLGIFMISFLHFGDWVEAGASAVFSLALFFLVSLACHTRLAALRPPGSHLTAFYLMVALGGALGGALNAFIVPAAFNRVVEYPLMLMASLMLHPDFRLKSRPGIAALALLAAAIPLSNFSVPFFGVDESVHLFFLIAALLSLACFVLFFSEKLGFLSSMLIGTIALFIVSQFFLAIKMEIFRTRSFYGAITLIEYATPIAGEFRTIRYLRHGNTVHGIQVTSPGYETYPASYYPAGGPLDQLFNAFQPKSVAVLGLGTGTVSCYTAPDRKFTFIDIDPVVVQVAKEHFTFLRHCAGDDPEIIVGDGRLELAKMKDRLFDMIVVDVFNSDAIPVHLLTKEAFDLYAQRLAPGGVIALNLSNRYLSLWKTTAASANAAGLAARAKYDMRDFPVYQYRSLWSAVTREGDMPGDKMGEGWVALPEDDPAQPWTDGYSSLFSVILFGLEELAQ